MTDDERFNEYHVAACALVATILDAPNLFDAELAATRLLLKAFHAGEVHAYDLMDERLDEIAAATRRT